MQTATNTKPLAPHKVREREAYRNPAAVSIAVRSKDPGSRWAGVYEERSDPAPREEFPLPTFDAVPIRPESDFEKDPDFQPVKTKLAVHIAATMKKSAAMGHILSEAQARAAVLTALGNQLASFRRTGFHPKALSRLLNLSPKEIKTHFPPPCAP